MPRLKYFLVAEGVSVDEVTKRVTAFNILDEIVVPDMPAVIPQLVAFTCWEVAPHELGTLHEQVLRQTLPHGRRDEIRARFRLHHRWQRTRQQLIGVPVQSEGELSFELVTPEGQTLARYSLEVKRLTREVVPPPSQRN